MNRYPHAWWLIIFGIFLEIFARPRENDTLDSCSSAIPQTTFFTFEIYTTLNTGMKLHHFTITITTTRPARRTLMGRGSEEPAKTSDTTVVIREEFVFILID